MTCNNCSGCGKEDDHEYQGFVPETYYTVGEFFKIDEKVFKVVSKFTAPSCEYCDFNNASFTYHCNTYPCFTTQTTVILYDTLEEDE